MIKIIKNVICAIIVLFVSIFLVRPAFCVDLENRIYPVQTLKSVNSILTLKVGDLAPGFTLPSISGEQVNLENYREKNHLIIAFVPAAWTPVCTNQIYDYTFYEDLLGELDTVILVISVDSIATLYAWTKTMTNLWYPVLSDFSPHGEVASRYGVLRNEGFAERATFVVDKKGIIRYINVNDINIKPDMNPVFNVLEDLK